MRVEGGARRAVVRGVTGALLVLVLVVVAGFVGAGERWGWLGVRIRDLSEMEMEDLAIRLGVTEGYGVVVVDVLTDTPAQTAGLRAGDVIVVIGDRPVVETRALQRLVGGTLPGRELDLVVLRDDKRRGIRVRVGEMPGAVVAERVAAEFGFLVREVSTSDLPPGAASLPDEPSPPVVAAVADESAAARGGLRVGDQIVAVNGRAVATSEGFRERFQDILLRNELELRIRRQGEPITLALPPAQPARSAP